MTFDAYTLDGRYLGPVDADTEGWARILASRIHDRPCKVVYVPCECDQEDCGDCK